MNCRWRRRARTRKGKKKRQFALIYAFCVNSVRSRSQHRTGTKTQLSAATNLVLDVSTRVTAAATMFSPSPFPSGAGRRTRNATPSRRSQIPGGSRAPSRFTTPAVGARVVSDSRMSVDDASAASDGASEMSVDAGTSVQRGSRHRPGVIFAQSEELRVSLLAHLPSEVLQVLKSASKSLSSILSLYYTCVD